MERRNVRLEEKGFGVEELLFFFGNWHRECLDSAIDWIGILDNLMERYREQVEGLCRGNVTKGDEKETLTGSLFSFHLKERNEKQ